MDVFRLIDFLEWLTRKIFYWSLMIGTIGIALAVLRLLGLVK
mgnify:CR=1 FL=1